MNISQVRPLVRHHSDPLRKLFLSITVLIASCLAQSTMADDQQLSTTGATRVEAESFTGRSDGWPYKDDCESCSGGARIVFFQNNKWFDVDVNVTKFQNYNVTLTAASENGADIEVEMISDSGAAYLGTITVPATGAWDVYADSIPQTIALPPGVRKLRFTNPTDSGANVDYITFDGDKSPQPFGPNINPLKGFGSSWDRKNEPHASVGFQYIEWGKFEPADDQFDWDYVEETLNRPGSKGRHVILQFVVDWDNHADLIPAPDSYRGPSWLSPEVTDSLVGPAVVDAENAPDRIGRATDYNHPEFLDQAIVAIDTLFNGDETHPGLGNDPRVFIIQVGVLGYFGEWHTYPVEEWAPQPFAKQAIFDAYINNLGGDGLTQVRYPKEDEDILVPQAGLGYTNGSATPTPHGYEFGELVWEDQLWMNGPIGGEWPPAIENEYWHRFFASHEGIFFLWMGGYSTMTPPTFAEIQEQVPGWDANPYGYFMFMHNMMGYNFHANVSSQSTKPDQTKIEVKLTNVGIAPFYKDWLVDLAIIDAQSGKVVDVIEANTDIRSLGPGQSTTIDGLSSKQLDADGEYEIGLRISQPGAVLDKDAGWKLKARNTYVELCGSKKVIPGAWDEKHALRGGWNIVANLKTEN